MKKNKKTIVVLAVLVGILIALVSWNQYTKANTDYVYGKIPHETVPEKYDEVDYTIPVIDEEGNRSTQTFTIDNDEEIGQIVKLHVFNGKVKKYEFLEEKELPKTVQNNL